jgi:Cu+-exporting ATPase
VKGGAALERLASVNAFAFDKTGTLTEGRLELGDVIPNGSTESELLRLAASAEQGSEHPIGRLVVAAAVSRNLPLAPAEGFRAHPGGGVAASVAGSPILVGTRRFLIEQGISIPDAADGALARLDESGQTTLLVAGDGKVIGAIGARDRIRPDAADVLAELRLSGVERVAMLTGDRSAAARNVAEALHINEAHAELLPAEKAERLANDRKTRFCFVGDGINDAPALARATVGVAVGTGTDVAAEAGDVITMGEPLRYLPLLYRLSRETVKVIRQNIVWFAFGVNIVGIVLTGWLWPVFAPSAAWYERGPLVAVLYHQVGSLAVLLNSMRLLGFERSSTSPALRTVRGRLKDFDQWLGSVRFDDLLHWLSHRWKPITVGVLLIAAICYAASGITTVGPNEVGVVKRFGRAAADLPPGLHLRWPLAIETVIKVRPAEVRMVEIGFRSLSGEGFTWSSAHGGFQRVSDESVMATGDGNVVEVSATLRYRIADPRTYLFGVQEPEALLRSAAESALREEVAAQPFLELLTTRRSSLQSQVSERLLMRLRGAAPGGIGVEIEGLTIHDLHPPTEVVSAYHDVARAIQARDQQVNRAEAQAIQVRKQAEEEALREVADAEAARSEKIETAKAGRDSFLYWLRLRTELPPEEMSHLSDEGARQEAIARRKRLTESRLAWEVLTEVLRGRDKVIIDADMPKGRRHLYLVDPDFLRPILIGPRPNEEGR